MKSMFRTQDMVLIAVMVATAGATYKIKHDAQDSLGIITKLQRQIRFEEDSIELLKADWSLLTQPSRLQKLTETYGNELALAPLGARQIVGLADIPLKPPPAPSEEVKAEARAPGGKRAGGRPAGGKPAGSKAAAGKPAGKMPKDAIGTGAIKP